MVNRQRFQTIWSTLLSLAASGVALQRDDASLMVQQPRENLSNACGWWERSTLMTLVSDYTFDTHALIQYVCSNVVAPSSQITPNKNANVSPNLDSWERERTCANYSLMRKISDAFVTFALLSVNCRCDKMVLLLTAILFIWVVPTIVVSITYIVYWQAWSIVSTLEVWIVVATKRRWNKVFHMICSKSCQLEISRVPSHERSCEV